MGDTAENGTGTGTITPAQIAWIEDFLGLKPPPDAAAAGSAASPAAGATGALAATYSDLFFDKDSSELTKDALTVVAQSPRTMGRAAAERLLARINGEVQQTRDIVVPDTVFSEVKRRFDDRRIVELTVLIGSYNMNARVLQALELDLEPPMP